MVDHIHKKGLKFSLDAIYAHARMQEFIVSPDYMRLRYNSSNIQQAIADVEYHLLPYTTQMKAMGYKNGAPSPACPLPPPLRETDVDTDIIDSSAFFDYEL
jgi:hypothetical protein